MTRETKIGMAVAVSFLCLVGVVVATKWRRTDDGPKGVDLALNSKEPDTGKGVANPPPPQQPTAKEPQVKQLEFRSLGSESDPSVKLPAGNVGESLSNPPVVPPPVSPGTIPFPAVPLPMVTNPDLSAVPIVVVPQVPSIAPFETDEAKRKALFDIKKQQDATLPPLPNPFEKVDEAKTKPGAMVDIALNKNNDFAKKAMDDINNRLPLTLPPPEINPALPPSKEINPMVPALPGLPPIETKAPALPTPKEFGLPPIKDASTNNPGFVIPQAKANDARVVNYDVQSFQARTGDTFTSLSRDVYKSEVYANALLAYNREFSSNRSMTTLQPGQTVLFPPLHVLQQNRYAGASADARPTIGGAPVSINPPVPLNQNRTFTPPTPTTDATKSHRIAAGGQKIYELAIQTLGDGSRWTEIYRLNPTIDPLQPIPGNTVVRLPGNANVP